MNENFKKNIDAIKVIFEDKNDNESKYLAIIDLGRSLPLLAPEYKSDLTKVDGCQSTTYLYSYFDNNVLHFKAESNALISSGLAALLIMAYDKQPPETIINNPPDFIIELGINTSLSPTRSNGLSQMYLRMKEDALKYFNQKQ
jgi:cysteine desulfuration protein SufE